MKVLKWAGTGWEEKIFVDTSDDDFCWENLGEVLVVFFRFFRLIIMKMEYKLHGMLLEYA